MQITFHSLLSACLLFVAVGPASAEPTVIPAGRDFGAGLTLKEPTPLAMVLARPERFAERPVLLRGRISDLCQKKGCWTILREGEAQLRVRFRDYAFFLPKDAMGAEAWVEGRVEVKVLSERERRHYAAESRDGDPASIRGPRREVGFTASGVRLVARD